MTALVLLLALQYPPGLTNSQKPGDEPTPPAEALKKIDVPEGFRVTLFAAEPDVAQPIALAFDDRGRPWVAECFSYSVKEWNSKVADRILVFEDQDNDGRFDKRTVFSDTVRNLTALVPGFGGVWAIALPELIFIPDRNGDAVPDGPPEVVLDGWDTVKVGHNVPSCLTWGPDGWLWGTQGIQGQSRVGRPGAPADQRVALNCAIWRYHPTRKLFEVVCQGTTNPFGFDFDARGEPFFTNCVTGHLWHAVYGAHYKRMYGTDFSPTAYELLDQTADHLHWTGSDWTKSRSGETHLKAGGGHAHTGAMVYLGDNWPEKYRGSIFMHNIHGRRLNQDRLEPRGVGYVGRHAEDMVISEDPWFRGVALLSGPDGGVWMSDWSDLGECHDNDGVHRTSGRIYKVVYGTPKDRKPDLSKLDSLELVKLLDDRNDWFVRHARRLLQERGADPKVHEALRKKPGLNALWALYVTGGLGPEAQLALLDHADEDVRAWGVRLLCDGAAPPAAAVKRFAAMAASDPSGRVRLHLASALQRIPPADRWPMIEALVARTEDAADPVQPLMVWYGLADAAQADRARAAQLIPKIKLPTITRLIARLVGEK